MIRLFILAAIFILTFQYSFSQNSFKNADSTCTCLESLLEVQNNKVDFSLGLENCLSKSFREAYKFSSSEMVDKYLVDLENFLKSNCMAFNQCQMIINPMYKQKTESRIYNPEICKMFKSGEFEEKGESEKTTVSMMDSIQIVKFEKSGYYTKSKVIWTDNCTFKLVFISSTNPYEKMMTKYGDTREIRIIDITGGKEIILETEFAGLYFLNKLTKL